jgi:DNA end-binding protein Ku
MQATGHVALARVGMYGREHVMILRPGKRGLIAHTMFYVDEIRSENEFQTDVESLSKKELDLARTFLEALEAPFAPEEFKDTYREELQSLIASKTQLSGVAKAESAGPVVSSPIDILEALKKSIALKRKPAASEISQAAKKGRVRKAR